MKNKPIIHYYFNKLIIFYMNIIKLKDIIMPQDMPQSELFNKYLKGKYAYWVQMRYIVPFDFMGHEGYVACEEDINKLHQREDGSWPRPYGAPSIDSYDEKFIYYIDSIETDRINNTIDFRMKNKYVTDSDITIDEIKKFRTWLAEELLKMDKMENGIQKYIYLSNTEVHVLNYYVNEMYDQVIKSLMEFGQTNISIENINTNVCGCHHSSNLSSLYNQSLQICDPISIYRKNIYSKMVEIFSNINFWTKWSPEFIGVFKKYIDNIINMNLPLSSSEFTSNFVDCGCSGDSNQKDLIEILKRLSKSLEYIKDEQIISHKNFIGDALYDWASLLYEKMRW